MKAINLANQALRLVTWPDGFAVLGEKQPVVYCQNKPLPGVNYVIRTDNYHELIRLFSDKKVEGDHRWDWFYRLLHLISLPLASRSFESPGFRVKPKPSPAASGGGSGGLSPWSSCDIDPGLDLKRKLYTPHIKYVLEGHGMGGVNPLPSSDISSVVNSGADVADGGEDVFAGVFDTFDLESNDLVEQSLETVFQVLSAAGDAPLQELGLSISSLVSMPAIELAAIAEEVLGLAGQMQAQGLITALNHDEDSRRVRAAAKILLEKIQQLRTARVQGLRVQNSNLRRIQLNIRDIIHADLIAVLKRIDGDLTPMEMANLTALLAVGHLERRVAMVENREELLPEEELLQRELERTLRRQDSILRRMLDPANPARPTVLQNLLSTYQGEANRLINLLEEHQSLPVRAAPHGGNGNGKTGSTGKNQQAQSKDQEGQGLTTGNKQNEEDRKQENDDNDEGSPPPGGNTAGDAIAAEKPERRSQVLISWVTDKLRYYSLLGGDLRPHASGLDSLLSRVEAYSVRAPQIKKKLHEYLTQNKAVSLPELDVKTSPLDEYIYQMLFMGRFVQLAQIVVDVLDDKELKSFRDNKSKYTGGSVRFIPPKSLDFMESSKGWEVSATLNGMEADFAGVRLISKELEKMKIYADFVEPASDGNGGNRQVARTVTFSEDEVKHWESAAKRDAVRTPIEIRYVTGSRMGTPELYTLYQTKELEHQLIERLRGQPDFGTVLNVSKEMGVMGAVRLLYPNAPNIRTLIYRMLNQDSFNMPRNYLFGGVTEELSETEGVLLRAIPGFPKVLPTNRRQSDDSTQNIVVTVYSEGYIEFGFTVHFDQWTLNASDNSPLDGNFDIHHVLRFKVSNQTEAKLTYAGLNVSSSIKDEDLEKRLKEDIQAKQKKLKHDSNKFLGHSAEGLLAEMERYRPQKWLANAIAPMEELTGSYYRLLKQVREIRNIYQLPRENDLLEWMEPISQNMRVFNIQESSRMQRMEGEPISVNVKAAWKIQKEFREKLIKIMEGTTAEAEKLQEKERMSPADLLGVQEALLKKEAELESLWEEHYRRGSSFDQLKISMNDGDEKEQWIDQPFETPLKVYRNFIGLTVGDSVVRIQRAIAEKEEFQQQEKKPSKDGRCKGTEEKDKGHNRVRHFLFSPKQLLEKGKKLAYNRFHSSSGAMNQAAQVSPQDGHSSHSSNSPDTGVSPIASVNHNPTSVEETLLPQDYREENSGILSPLPQVNEPAYGRYLTIPVPAMPQAHSMNSLVQISPAAIIHHRSLSDEYYPYPQILDQTKDVAYEFLVDLFRTGVNSQVANEISLMVYTSSSLSTDDFINTLDVQLTDEEKKTSYNDEYLRNQIALNKVYERDGPIHLVNVLLDIFGNNIYYKLSGQDELISK